MFNVDAYDLTFMGEIATFDVVTLAGAVCATIFLTGFITACRMERRRVTASRPE